jgi:chromosome segregation ATPase
MKEMLSEELLLQIKSHNDKGLYKGQYDPSPVIDRMYHDIRSLQQEAKEQRDLLVRIKNDIDEFGRLVGIDVSATSFEEKGATFNRAINTLQQQVNTLQGELNIAHYANETLSNQFHKIREHNHMQGQQIQSLREQVNTLTKQIEAALTDLEAYKPLTAIVVLKSALHSIKESPREEQTPKDRGVEG